jgi:hypothetical protein
VSDGRILVVTVGTSLFSSASWRGEGFFNFPRYRRWLEELDADGRPFWLRSPERRARDEKTCERVGALLTVKAPAELSPLVTIDGSEDPRRYCAELTTLLVTYRETSHGAASFREFLSRYESVALVCPSNRDDEASLAARHLESILLFQGARNGSGTLLKQTLRSGSSRGRIQQWGEFLGTLDADDVDLVVTGGYKGFALLAGDAWARTGSKRGWRVIYLHQDNETDLFVHEGDRIVARSPGQNPETVYRPAGETV